MENIRQNKFPSEIRSYYIKIRRKMGILQAQGERNI